VYVRNLLRQFAALDLNSEFIAYVSELGAETHVDERFLTRHVSSNPLKRLGIDLPRCLRADLPDLIHVQYTAPLRCPVPIVVSVHDVSFLERPEYFPPVRAFQLQTTVRRTVRLADRVLTPSEFSAKAIRAVYSLPEEKVTVIPNGTSSNFRPIAPAIAQARVKERFGFGFPYILMVGDLQPRKNQVGLIRAFEELVRHEPKLPHHLVLTGQNSWYASRVQEAARQSSVASRIHFTGFVSDEELLNLYNACQLFVFPSFYEGFGLPVLEAMACGRAVACSNTTAVVEVADGAAITFDPKSTGEMMRAMRDVLVDGELRARMERLGIKRASGFHWRDAAAATLKVYEEVAMTRALETVASRRAVAARP
jgi:glycosyltransferase involved in cell wall biosynthesis